MNIKYYQVKAKLGQGLLKYERCGKVDKQLATLQGQRGHRGLPDDRNIDNNHFQRLK